MTKASPKDIAQALAVMGVGIDNFPTTRLGLDIVQDSIERHAFSSAELRSLVRIACDTMRRWSLPEFLSLRKAVSDQVFYERETQEHDRKLAEWKREALGLGPGEQFAIPDSAVKRIPPTIAASAVPAPADPAPEPKPVRRIPSLREAEAELAEQLAQNKRRSEEEAARILADLEAQIGIRKIVN